MDNVTHALVGAAMAECAVPRGALARTRTVFIAAGVVAANAPDVDLLYTGLTEAPLGYLLHRRWRIDAEEVRALYAANCRVRAWLQFGRVPHVANGSIADLRFEHPIGQNLTLMAVETSGPRCPSFVTGWELPRHDVLTDSSDSR